MQKYTYFAKKWRTYDIPIFQVGHTFLDITQPFIIMGQLDGNFSWDLMRLLYYYYSRRPNSLHTERGINENTNTIGHNSVLFWPVAVNKLLFDKSNPSLGLTYDVSP